METWVLITWLQAGLRIEERRMPGLSREACVARQMVAGHERTACVRSGYETGIGRTNVLIACCCRQGAGGARWWRSGD